MNDQIDTSIPVLTEILVTDESAQTAKKTEAAIAHNAVASTAVNVNHIQTPKISSSILEKKHDALAPEDLPALPSLDDIGPQLSAEEWKHLEQSIRENVLQQVLSRIDFVLEHRVRDSLAEVLQASIDKLAEEIRGGLKNSLEEVVTRALNQEISKAKASR